MRNAHQQLVVENYDHGAFDHLEPEDSHADVGDTFFTAIMTELSTAEGCETREDALCRIRTMKNQLEELEGFFDT